MTNPASVAGSEQTHPGSDMKPIPNRVRPTGRDCAISLSCAGDHRRGRPRRLHDHAHRAAGARPAERRRRGGDPRALVDRLRRSDADRADRRSARAEPRLARCDRARRPARAQYKIARSSLYPTVNLGVDASRSRNTEPRQQSAAAGVSPHRQRFPRRSQRFLRGRSLGQVPHRDPRGAERPAGNGIRARNGAHRRRGRSRPRLLPPARVRCAAFVAQRHARTAQRDAWPCNRPLPGRRDRRLRPRARPKPSAPRSHPTSRRGARCPQNESALAVLLGRSPREVFEPRFRARLSWCG